MPQTRKEACSGNTLELRATAGEWQWIHPMRTPYDVPGGHLRWAPSLQCLNGITCLLKTRGKIWISPLSSCVTVPAALSWSALAGNRIPHQPDLHRHRSSTYAYMKTKRVYQAVALGAVLLGAAAFLLIRLLRPEGLPEGLIQANGRMEGDHLTVASKFPGRIQALLVREGDLVTTGQVMVRIDDVQTRSRVDQARHGWEATEAQVQSVHTSLAVLNLEVPLAIESAQSHVDEAKATLEKSKAVEQEARLDEQRLRSLLPEQAVAQQQYEQALARWNVAKSEVQVARATLAKTMKELAQAELGWKRIHAKEDEVAALESQRDQLEAVLNEAESVLADLTIHAPANGPLRREWWISVKSSMPGRHSLRSWIWIDCISRSMCRRFKSGRFGWIFPRVSIPMPFPNSRSMQRCDTLPQRPSSPRKKSKLQTNA